MPLDFEALSNWDFEEIEQTLTERDTILYALGLGFGEDPTDKKELAYVYEDGLKAVPSMAVILGYPGFWLRDPKTGVNWQKVLHGEQWLDIYKPLPTHARLVGRSKIDRDLFIRRPTQRYGKCGCNRVIAIGLGHRHVVYCDDADLFHIHDDRFCRYRIPVRINYRCRKGNL